MSSKTSTPVDPGRVIVLGSLALVAALFIVATAKVLFVLFAGVLFALVLRESSTKIAKFTHLPTGVVLAVLVLGGLTVGVLFITLVAPQLVEQFEALRRALPRAFESIRDLRRQAVGGDAGAIGVLPVPKPASTDLVQSTASAIGGSVEVLGGLIVVFFVGVYSAAQPELYLNAVLSLVPRAQQERVARTLVTVERDLTRWLIGRLVAMAFVGVGTGIAFAMFKLPMAAALAVFAGLLTFIEYAGSLISAIPPVLLAFTVSPMTALWVIVVYVAIHTLEGYGLTPLLARLSVRLPPAFTLAAQVLLAVLVGPLGLTFSTPLLVVVISAVRVWRSEDSGANPSAA